jgi:glycerol-3-phosphate cytidylyltransferase-like family protein
MQKVIVYLDHFPILHNGYTRILEKLKNHMVKSQIDKCIIMIADDLTYPLPYLHRENMFKKVLGVDETVDVMPVDDLRIFKIIKELELNNDYSVTDIFVNEINYDTVKANTTGLDCDIKKFKHNYDYDTIKNLISNNDYFNYCKHMPIQLHDEFQNYIEIFTKDKLNEFYKLEIKQLLNL